jgi:hypothetical protein
MSIPTWYHGHLTPKISLENVQQAVNWFRLLERYSVCVFIRLNTTVEQSDYLEVFMTTRSDILQVSFHETKDTQCTS